MAATAVYSGVVTGSASNMQQNVQVKHVFTFSDGATAGTIPVYTVSPAPTGLLMGIGVVFGATAPNTLTVTVKDADGLTIATGTVTASSRIELLAPVPFVEGMTVTLSGNTTVNALGTVALYWI